MKIEEGIMVMKDGKAWGEWYDGSHGGGSGGCFMDPEIAKIYDSRFVKKPTDVTYNRGPGWEELLQAKIVRVRRKTSVEVEVFQ